MTNADKFKTVFGMYSEEFWAKPEDDMLNWINSEYQKPKFKVNIQPVKHGRWIPGTLSNNKVANECSICLAISVGTMKPHYCPNCGAKMDGAE